MVVKINLTFVISATGEPAVCLSYVIVGALREAIKSARKDSGVEGWFQMGKL